MVATYLHTVRQFRRSVRLYLLAVALVGFTYDGGIYAVIFNLYLLRLGFGPDFVGQVNAAGMVAFALSAFPAGALGDRWGNRRLMIVGIATLFAGSLLLALGGFAPLGARAGLLGAYVLMNIGVSCFFVNCVPYLITITTVAERSPAFAVQSAFLSLAAFAGSLLGGFLPGYFALVLATSLDRPEPYRHPLWLATGLLLVGLWALASMRPDPDQLANPQEVTAEEPAQARRDIWRLIGLLTLVRLFFVVGSAVAMTFFNVYMDAGLQVPTAQIGIAVAVSRFVAVPAALLTPLLAARLGNAPLSLWASVGAALFLIPLALASVWQTAALAYVGVIAMTSIRYPAFLVYSMSMIPMRYRSVVAGAGEMAAGFSFALIALAGGYLIVTHGYRTLFFTGAALNLLGTLVFGLFIATRRTP